MSIRFDYKFGKHMVLEVEFYDDGERISPMELIRRCNNLNGHYNRASADRQLVETVLMDYKDKVKQELTLLYMQTDDQKFKFLAERLGVTLDEI